MADPRTEGILAAKSSFLQAWGRATTWARALPISSAGRNWPLRTLPLNTVSIPGPTTIDRDATQAAVAFDFGITEHAGGYRHHVGQARQGFHVLQRERFGAARRPDSAPPPVLVTPGWMPTTLVPNWVNSAST